jgi:hypothetical protein
MIHVNIKIIILVYDNKSKLENDLKWKVFKTYLDVSRMPHNDFPDIKQLKFGFLPGPITTLHCDFLKYLRNKPELVYNILSFDINSMNEDIEPIIKKRTINEENIRKIKEEKIHKKYDDDLEKLNEEIKDKKFLEEKMEKLNEEIKDIKLLEKKMEKLNKEIKDKKLLEYKDELEKLSKEIKYKELLEEKKKKLENKKKKK